jgi:hypothetical protein
MGGLGRAGPVRATPVRCPAGDGHRRHDNSFSCNAAVTHDSCRHRSSCRCMIPGCTSCKSRAGTGIALLCLGVLGSNPVMLINLPALQCDGCP